MSTPVADKESPYKGLLGWIDARMPTLMSGYKKHLSEYCVPKNFNFGGRWRNLAAPSADVCVRGRAEWLLCR